MKILKTIRSLTKVRAFPYQIPVQHWLCSMHMKWFTGCFLLLCVIVTAGCSEQTKPAATNTKANQRVGGPCDGCELMYEGMPTAMAAIDTSPGWKGAGQKVLIRGKIFKPDGTTPAPGVILYYWQTNKDGLYSPQPGRPEKSSRHGAIRG